MKKHSKEELLNDKSSHMGARFMYSFGMAFIVFSFLLLMYSTTAFIICMAVGLFLFFKGKKEYNLFMEKNKLKQKMYVTPVKTKIVASGISKKAGSAAVRTAIGGAVGGLPGAIYGSATAKSKADVTFYVTYEDGHKASETVSTNSSRFNELMKVCED